MFALLCYYRGTFCSRSILMQSCPGRYTKVFCITFSFFFFSFEQVTCHIVASFDIAQNAAMDLVSVTKIPSYSQSLTHFRSGSASLCLRVRRSQPNSQTRFLPQWVTSCQAHCFPQTGCLKWRVKGGGHILLQEGKGSLYSMLFFQTKKPPTIWLV